MTSTLLAMKRANQTATPRRGIRQFNAPGFAVLAALALSLAVTAAETRDRSGDPDTVRLCGRSFCDKTGPFLGLGASYFQALRHAKYDRARLNHNLAFLASNGFNYVRILSMVNWDGLEIAPVTFTNRAGHRVEAWPDYWQRFRDLLDLAGRHGLRVEVTIFADAQYVMPQRSARWAHLDGILANIAGRESRLIHFEVANEAWQNGFPGKQGVAELRAFTQHLAERTKVLVAITSNDDTSDQGIISLYKGSAADLATVHFSRDIRSAEGGWLPVRDCSRAGRLPGVPPVSSNEPIGPGASVSSESDPIKLCSAAVFAYLAGLPAYVFHSSAGVYARERFEDTPGIGALRFIRRILSGDLASWERNDGLEPTAPFTVFCNGQSNRYWLEVSGATNGCHRNIGSAKSGEFICFPMGILENGVSLEARRSLHVQGVDPLTGVTITNLTMTANQRLTLPRGPGAYILKGRYLDVPPASPSAADPVRVILDTDMSGDCDDAGALALLHALADQGECELLATVVNRKDLTGASAAATDALNTFYGRPALPIGTDKRGPTALQRTSPFARALRDEFPNDIGPDAHAPDALDVYREVLAAQPDGSVVICSVGALSNLAVLWRHAPDLVRKKVRRLVVMGGQFPKSQQPETNLATHREAAQFVAAEWPGEIVWHGWEVGNALFTGAALKQTPPKNPVRRAYELKPFGRRPAIDGGQPSWDQAAALFAVRGSQPELWEVVSGGRVRVDDRGNTTWETDAGVRHSYVKMRGDPKRLAAVIEDLMIRPPAAPPYPPSPVIAVIEWAPTNRIIRAAPDGDNWPVTWADDDALYTTWGDGTGFEPKVEKKLSLGFARVIGRPDAFTGINVRSPTEQLGQGRAGKKGWGMLCIEGVLYLWLGHADSNGASAQLAWSHDHARTWTFAGWKFAELGLVGFVNFGQDYAGARDGFVYAYSHDGPRADTPADRFILMRAPKDKLASRESWWFFAARDAAGRPVWTRDIHKRGGVFQHPGACLRSAMTYCAPLKRYLWWQQLPQPPGTKDRGDTRFSGGFAVYDAPEPWGPWTTAFFTKEWDVGPGEHGDFPAKWMSTGGQTLHLVFSGDDCFSIRQATLTLNPNRGSNPSAK